MTLSPNVCRDSGSYICEGLHSRRAYVRYLADETDVSRRTLKWSSRVFSHNGEKSGEEGGVKGRAYVIDTDIGTHARRLTQGAEQLP